MKELSKIIGQEYWINEGPFRFRVLVDDVKQAYGNDRALVSPVGGSNWAWVNVDRLSVDVEG